MRVWDYWLMNSPFFESYASIVSLINVVKSGPIIVTMTMWVLVLVAMVTDKVPSMFQFLQLGNVDRIFWLCSCMLSITTVYRFLGDVYWLLPQLSSLCSLYQLKLPFQLHWRMIYWFCVCRRLSIEVHNSIFILTLVAFSFSYHVKMHTLHGEAP